MKKFITFLAIILLTPLSVSLGTSTPFANETNLNPKIAHNFDLLTSDGFGELKISLTAAEVVQILGDPQSKGEQQFWGADGLYHQKWNYPQQGIILDMAGETEQGSSIISSIRVQAPSQLKTKRGIGIGDSSAKVKQAYAQEEDEAAPISSDYFVAGSVYGGLIFEFKNNQVIEMFLGAMAE